MVEIEKQGTPTVLIVSGRFEHGAQAGARAFGMPEVRYVVVPWIYRNLDRSRTIQQTEAAFEELAGELTADLGGSSKTVKLDPTDAGRFSDLGKFPLAQIVHLQRIPKALL